MPTSSTTRSVISILRFPRPHTSARRCSSSADYPGAARSARRLLPHDQLKRLPPGWPQDHPQAAMFLWKDVVFGSRLADDEALSPDLPDLLAEGYANAAPVFRFLESLR
ncbi:MAG TPA: DUF2461 family protein [Candidatus Limnocylindria bacterium]|nr:DUF2461 family protein [Candidatus Limnocylindria bacterium]